MQAHRTFLLVASLLAFLVVFSGTNALAATPDFTIAATNVTMSSSGSSGIGFTSFTLASVNGYAGTVAIGCLSPSPPAGVKVPYCGGSVALPAYTLTANQVVTENISLFNEPVPMPVSLPRRGGHGLAPGLALASALLLGFGFRRRAARWLMLMLLAAGTLAGLVGIGACGANNTAVTPGTYAYTITATDINTNASVNTAFNVTVP